VSSLLRTRQKRGIHDLPGESPWRSAGPFSRTVTDHCPHLSKTAAQHVEGDAYLLSDERRNNGVDGSDLGTIMARGHRTVAWARTYLRHRGSPSAERQPERVREVAAWLGYLTAQDMQVRFDPAAMEACDIYMFRADDADAEEWGVIWWAFTRLRFFYTAASEHGGGCAGRLAHLPGEAPTMASR